MQTASLNRVTQFVHGPYNAVDISANPDRTIYAPEDGSITGYGPAGRCGNRLELTGISGRHGFCHLEKPLVNLNDFVKRGQPIGIMGFSGFTIPEGELGRHLHWVLKRGNTYLYPLDLVNQSFIVYKGDEMATPRDIDLCFKGMVGRDPTSDELTNPDFLASHSLLIETCYNAGADFRDAAKNNKFKKVQVYIEDK